MTVKCFKKAQIDKIWKQNLDKNKGKTYKNELNKLVAKKVKATLKKNELSYASTDSETSL